MESIIKIGMFVFVAFTFLYFSSFSSSQTSIDEKVKEEMGAVLNDFDTIVISHNHSDHVGRKTLVHP